MYVCVCVCVCVWAFDFEKRGPGAVLGEALPLARLARVHGREGPQLPAQRAQPLAVLVVHLSTFETWT